MLRQIKNLSVRIWKDEQGASLLEYSVLIGLIVAGVVATITAVGGWTGTRWTSLLDVLNTSNPPPAGGGT
jgi:pilus assembly protein Flp/PilA